MQYMQYIQFMQYAVYAVNAVYAVSAMYAVYATYAVTQKVPMYFLRDSRDSLRISHMSQEGRRYVRRTRN